MVMVMVILSVFGQCSPYQPGIKGERGPPGPEVSGLVTISSDMIFATHFNYLNAFLLKNIKI